jgi:hypothetical protein
MKQSTNLNSFKSVFFRNPSNEAFTSFRRCKINKKTFSLQALKVF